MKMSVNENFQEILNEDLELQSLLTMESDDRYYSMRDFLRMNKFGKSPITFLHEFWFLCSLDRERLRLRNNEYRIR